MKVRAVAAVCAVAAVVLPALPAHATMSVLYTAPVLRGPAAIAFDPAMNLAYVGSVTDDQITVFAGFQAVGRIMQSGLNPAGLAVDPAGRRLIVASHNADRVNIYDTTDRHKVGAIDVADGPWGVAVDPSNGRAFIAALGAGMLIVIERTNEVRTIPLPGCAGPIGVAHSAPTGRVLVTCIYSGTVLIIDAATLSIITSIEFGLGAYTWGIAAHATEPLAYVTNWAGGAEDSGTVVVLDPAAATVSTVAFIGGGPAGIALSHAGTPWVTLSALHRVAILDGVSGQITDQVSLPTDPSVPGRENNPLAVAVHPSGRFAVVGNFHAESVSFVATATAL